MEATINQVKKILFAAFELEFEAMSNQITALQSENGTLRAENGTLTKTKNDATTALNAIDTKYQNLENAHEKMRIKYDELRRCVEQFNLQMAHFGILPIAGTPVHSSEPADNVYDAGDSDEMVEDDDDDADDSCDLDDGKDIKPNGKVDLLTDNHQEMIKHESLTPSVADVQMKDSNGSLHNDQTGNSTPYPCLYPNCKLKYSALWALNRHIATHNKDNERSQPQRKWY